MKKFLCAVLSVCFLMAGFALLTACKDDNGGDTESSSSKRNESSVEAGEAWNPEW